VGNKGPDVCFQLRDELVLVDVTIVNPLAPSYVEAEAESPGTTLQLAADDLKDRRHVATAAVRKMAFFPLAFTTYGVPSKRTRALLLKCAYASGEGENFLRHALMALGVAIQRGNAQIIAAAHAEWWTSGVR
jgi:hypothetical protein